MNKILIRPMIPTDKISVEKICIETAPNSMKFNDRRIQYTLLMYNRYYTRVLKHSFVAVDENNNPIGYILCAPDFNAYYDSFSKNELKQIKRQSIFDYFMAYSELKLLKKYSTDYPAHLHIDIFPTYQGQGIGRSLIDALEKYLKSISTPGLMLSVSSRNKGAVEFYKHCGFEIILNGAGIVFGKKF